MEIRRRAGLPVGATTAAVWLVAAVSAALNYTHGAADPNASWHGVVMALVSVAGIAVHQISHWRTDVITAARAWWTGRAARRLDRAARRRVARFERAAVRSATALLHADGRVELRYPDGPVALTRFGRRVAEAPAYSLAEDVARMIDRTAAVTGFRPVALPGSGPVNLHEQSDPTPVAADASDPDRELYREVRDLIADGQLSSAPSGWRIYTHVMNRSGDKARAYRVAALLADDQNRPHSIEQEEVA
ncbi:hypothetical protein [Kutzneria sp. 744]|uniref:hypothetical protein n=1 Tax=Kutzneria sp. (strain 744) TaxID=345341 RepID=UPI0003EEADFA|nr:hypothetical protein [Kutzneria sp. 744]EWM14608.1 hypothetical protein KUTG_04912 [Kutzneria sp. 744]